MLKRMIHNMKKQTGSATIEAVVAFTGFLFVVFTILGTVDFCRAQMRVSAAVDTVARELAQYSYFYEMSGLQKFEKASDPIVGVGKKNINEVIGTVDSLYSALGGAVEGTSEDMANLADVTTKGDLQLQDIETVVKNIDTSGKNIANSITSIGNALEHVGDDPLLYMRSLVAIAGEEGMELAKRAIASSLAKLFIQKHFGDSWSEANENLEKLGVVGGLDGMNFNLSTLFSDEDREDVEIVVFYKVKLLQLLDWQTLEANISKRAVCRAWLGGDDVQERIKPEAEGMDLGEPKKPEPAEGENPAEGEQPAEGEESEKQPVDTTGSDWYLGDGGYGTENAGVEEAFKKRFDETYNIAPDTIGSRTSYVTGRDREDKPTNVAYKWDYATSPDPNEFDMGFVMGQLMEANEAIKEGSLPEDMDVIRYVLYVPENIPEEDRKALEEAASDAVTDYVLYNRQYPDEELSKIAMRIDIVPAGGNYDYSSGG